jgi:hypothetical protein
VTTDHTAALELTVGWTGTDSNFVAFPRGNDLLEDRRQSHVVLLTDYYMSKDSVRPSSCGCWEINPNTSTFDSGSEGRGPRGWPLGNPYQTSGMCGALLGTTASRQVDFGLNSPL